MRHREDKRAKRQRRIKNKASYKLLMIMLKYLPVLVSFVYTINIVVEYFSHSIPVHGSVAGMSITTCIFMCIATRVFEFCIYHKVLIYYILGINLLKLINYYTFSFVIPYYEEILLYSSITCISLFIILYIYVKYYKGLIVKNCR